MVAVSCGPGGGGPGCLGGSCRSLCFSGVSGNAPGGVWSREDRDGPVLNTRSRILCLLGSPGRSVSAVDAAAGLAARSAVCCSWQTTL